VLGYTSVPAANKWFENLRYAGFPNTVVAKYNSLLLAYSNVVKDNIGASIELSTHQHIISEIAAKDLAELQALTQLLSQLGYVHTNNSNSCAITADGWNHIDKNQKSEHPTDSAFVAMWFDSCTANYRAAVISALRNCGFEPLFVDETIFNGFIMDQIIALIRRSRFIVSDFTCRREVDEESIIRQGVRGGVYWEAGLAYGMGKPVIHTCEDNEASKRRIHFDVAQYRTLFWKNEELTTDIRDLSRPVPDPKFAERLAQHILATVGKGSYSSQ
jgi:hypothetical protein